MAGQTGSIVDVEWDVGGRELAPRRTRRDIEGLIRFGGQGTLPVPAFGDPPEIAEQGTGFITGQRDAPHLCTDVRLSGGCAIILPPLLAFGRLYFSFTSKGKVPKILGQIMRSRCFLE